jgi:hypothetical protein
MSDITHDPQALASYIETLGGTVIEGEKFRFEMPLSETRKIIPEVNKLGLRCERVAERVGNDLQGKVCNIATIAVYRKPPPTEYESAQNLMMVATGTG